jgi:hypothetical protein
MVVVCTLPCILCVVSYLGVVIEDGEGRFVAVGVIFGAGQPGVQALVVGGVVLGLGVGDNQMGGWVRGCGVAGREKSSGKRSGDDEWRVV